MDLLIDHQKTKRKFTCKFNHTLTGYLQYRYPPDCATNRNIEITWVYVNPKYRLQGIATLLIKAVIKFAKKQVWISLWTGKQMEIDGS